MKYAFTAATLAATLGLSLAAAVAVEPRQSTSYVKTSGQKFTLDGSKFTVVGVRDILIKKWLSRLTSLVI